MGWRFPVGVTIFVAGFASPLAIPLVTSSDLPTGWKTAIAGGLAVGVPEIMMVLAGAVMGKEGFAELKRRFGRFFAKYGPPEQVGRRRNRWAAPATVWAWRCSRCRCCWGGSLRISRTTCRATTPGK